MTTPHDKSFEELFAVYDFDEDERTLVELGFNVGFEQATAQKAAEVNENLIKILTHFMPFIESERGCPYQKPWVEKAEAEIAAAQQGKGE